MLPMIMAPTKHDDSTAIGKKLTFTLNGLILPQVSFLPVQFDLKAILPRHQILFGLVRLAQMLWKYTIVSLAGVFAEASWYGFSLQ